MNRCKYVDAKARCERPCTVHADKRQPSKVERYKDPNGKDEWTVQASYPTYPDDYCYYHGKIVERLIEKKMVK